MMNGQHILITGASSGIGEAVARKAAAQGAALTLVARNTKKLAQLAKELAAQYDTSTLVVKCDMSEPKQIERLVKKSMQRFKKIDVLLNCAGYGTFKDAVEFSYDEIVEMFKVNTFGMMYLSQLSVPHMSKGSRIFFVSSIAGKIATPASSVYSASKSAILSYANALRLELKAKGIMVTSINPGPVRTEFFSHDERSQQYYERVKDMSLSVDTVAEQIIRVAMTQSSRREINLPLSMSLAANLYNLFPKIGDFLALTAFNLK
ncbi:SDR family oxidoreductase [Aerococcaceae bacterium zg-ZUI334]|uniref:SDR family NAD(P)-dependent oxidoreductase n=1 Tax=Aerococcaceae bacterium zg-252 TaxID=2796928 RepID=UPI001BA22998|nr:SDR family oxidoreductase [Aerococcaceae bacterium zg-ZUI334]